MLVLDFCRPGVPGIEEWDACIEAMIRARRSTGKSAVVVSSFPELLPETARDKLIAGGVVPLQGLEQAMEALAGAAHYGAMRAAAQARAAAGALQLDALAALAAEPAEVIDEVESKRRLAAFGLSVPEGRVVSAAAAPAAASTLGFPVALKAAGSAFNHKTELGAVALNLKSEDAVREAAAAMQGRLKGHDRFLVERMVGSPVAELIIGIKRDPQFGLALVLGAGGILVNLVEDAATLLLPTDRASVEAALDGLKVARLLKGYRGQPPGDQAAVIEAVLAVAAYAASERERLLELDVNPLLVLPEGQGEGGGGAVAADALIRLAGPG
jgi:acetyl-CoA synthetase